MKYYFLIIVATLVGCWDKNTVSFSLGDDVVEKKAQLEFKSQGIWYEKSDDGKFEFKTSDIEKVKKIFGNIAQTIIPDGRAKAYGPEVEKFVILELKNMKIPYDVRLFQGQKWFVWEEKNEIAFINAEKKAYEKFKNEFHKSPYY